MSKTADLISRHDSLKADRANHEAVIQEVLEYVLPRKAEVTVKRSKGTLDMTKVYDSTPIQANEILAAHLGGLLTNVNTEWFDLKMKDEALREDHEVKLWLETTKQIMRRYIWDSNFDTQAHELFLDLGSAGTTAMYIEAGPGGRGLRFHTRHISEVVVAENETGLVDTVFRKFSLSARQAKRLFGRRISRKVQEQLKKESTWDQESEYLHVVFPRQDREPGKRDAANKPYASIYIDIADEKIVGEGGYDEWPWAVPRWIKLSGEVYGRSPGMTALPDIRMLNQMMKTIIRAAQKQTDPPLFMPDDGVIKPVITKPSGLNYYDASRFGQQGMKIDQLPVGRPDIGWEMVKETRASIRAAFYNDLLDLQHGPQMTAFETAVRDERQRRVLGPILGRMNSEFLQPLISRVFGLLWRQGAIPKPPSQAEGAEFAVEFTSPIAQAQRQHEAMGYQLVMQEVGALSQLAGPAVLDNYDMDEVARKPVELHGASPTLLRSEEERDKLRQQRAEAEAQQAQLQQAAMQAELAKGTGEAAKVQAEGAMAQQAATQGAEVLP